LRLEQALIKLDGDLPPSHWMRPELDAALAASDEMRRILAADLRDELVDIKIARNTAPAIAAFAMLDTCLAKRKGEPS